MRRRIIDWLDHRTGIETAVRNFLFEEIPASSGWHQVFGSVAVFLFLVQAFTGILLAFNYAPTPGEAYNSVKYIVSELTGGRMIRGLHHWGASLMIVVVVLHMAQVFLYGAYKKPREATWMAGVALLLLTLAYGLTGYLLPWDNRAYWGTVVATQIAGKVPVLGPYLQRLLGDGAASVGVVTFARFYALHVLLLPPATTFLIALHIYLVRKHGVMPLPGDEAPKKKFYPEQVFRDTIAIFFTFAVLFTLAVSARVPLDRLADPTDTSYIPRPDWYFLFLFQLLKFFEGPLEVVGSVVLPGLAVLALILAPFLDRGVVRRVRERTLALGVLALAAIGWGGLTAAAVVTTPKTSEVDVTVSAGADDWQQLSPEELAGVGYYRKENCAACHAGGKVGPDLTRGIRKSAAWMIEHFKRPQQMMPGSSMPPLQLSDPQLNALAAFLLKLNQRTAGVLESAPQFAVEGAMLYQGQKCGVCHQVNGIGVKLGPPLNGVGQRRTRDWIEEHFRDPQKLSPGSVMPPYRFNSRDMDRITSYLLGLPPR
ncbi:MAG: cytochrome b N-terminal domain-containing protein [Acidobacteria bacterium]|nr:cytochrome b N-terminal domain-containing protein [Acidobacteriota bacterium]MBI3281856.1 cytochrome b N-terminal domain-containing protein [Acidobacteriota bacterium]